MDCKRWHNWWTVFLLRSATKSSFQVARELCSLLINSCPSFSKWGKPSVKLLLRNDLTEVVCSSSWQLVLNTECGRQSVAKKPYKLGNKWGGDVHHSKTFSSFSLLLIQKNDWNGILTLLLLVALYHPKAKEMALCRMLKCYEVNYFTILY